MKRNSLSLIMVLLCAVSFVSTTAHAEPPTMLKKCQTCHGKQLTGKKKNPSIVGLPYEKLLASLTSDVPKKMKRVTSKLTDDQKVELSQYIFKLEKP